MTDDHDCPTTMKRLNSIHDLLLEELRQASQCPGSEPLVMKLVGELQYINTLLDVLNRCPKCEGMRAAREQGFIGRTGQA